MLCVLYGAAAFRLLSVVTSEPLKEPTVAGVKLIRLVHLDPEASVPGLELDCGQVEPLPIANPGEMLGFKPVAGTGNVSGALPIFVSVTVRGLLVEPTAVDAKLRLGGSAKSNFFTVLLSATKTLPLPSTATPVGLLKPPPSVLTVV
jgi:hypothetical protein